MTDVIRVSHCPPSVAARSSAGVAARARGAYGLRLWPHFPHALALAAIVALALPTPADAQAEPAAGEQEAVAAAQDAPATDAPPAADEAAPARPWPPPFAERRFLENWEPLDWSRPREGARNIFDKAKAIPLNDSGSVWLGVGGQARGRMAYQSTVTFGGPGDFEPTMWTWRFRGHADLHLGKHFRTYGEYIYSYSSIQALVDTFGAPSSRLGDPGAPNLNGDILNLFAEYTSPAHNGWQASVWAGRRELQLGHERILSPGNWLLNRHTFDGTGGSVGNGKHRIEAFVVNPLIPVPDMWNDRDEDTTFWGVFYNTTLVGTPEVAPGAAGGAPQRLTIEPYLLQTRRKDVQTVQAKADEDRYTMGVLMYGDVGGTGFDFEFEGVYQGGRWETPFERGRLDAYAFVGEFGYRFRNTRFYPRPWISFDYASGDKDPDDAKLGTFDPLYPLTYAFFGFHAAFERRNLVVGGLHLDAVLARNVYFRSNYLPVMRRAQSGDGMYDSFGNISRRPDPQSSGGDAPDLSTASMILGQQWDFGVAWQATPQLLLYGTYLHFFTGQFWKDTQTAPARSMNGVMVLTQYNF